MSVISPGDARGDTGDALHFEGGGGEGAEAPFRLFYSPGACSLAVHIVLEETGAPYVMDLRRSKSTEGVGSAEYTALNPKQRVPALRPVPGKSGGVAGILTEGLAILVFLARRYPEAGLVPTDPVGEARMLEWMNWLSSDLHACGFGGLWRPDRFVHDPELFPRIEEKARDNIRARYDDIEAIFADGRDWSVPGAFSIVDAFSLVFWRWGARIGMDMKLRPHWSAVMHKVLARPSAQAALSKGHT